MLEKEFDLQTILDEFGKQNCFIIDSNYNVAGMNESDDMFEYLYNNNSDFVKLVQSLIKESDIYFDSSSEKSALIFALDTLGLLDYFDGIESGDCVVKIVESIEEAFDTEFIHQVKTVAESYGYGLDECWRSSRMGNFLRFYSYPLNQQEDNGYTPKIYVDEDENNNIEFRMQTTSYGSLCGENLEKFMKEVNDGYNFVKYLNNLNWKECPIMDR